jgi:hypothetical protein
MPKVLYRVTLTQEDREGHTCDAVLRTRTAREVGLRLGNYISPASVLCIEQSRIL